MCAIDSIGKSDTGYNSIYRKLGHFKG